MFSSISGLSFATDAFLDRASVAPVETDDDWLPEHLGRRFFAAAGIETELGNKAPEGAVAGSAIGAVLGAIICAVAALGSVLTLPGLDTVIANPWVAALIGAAAGAASGCAIGALVGLSMLEERLKRPEEEFRSRGRRAPTQLYRGPRL